jgi:hypothetical protein
MAKSLGSLASSAAFVADRLGFPKKELEHEARPLHGGLESAGVLEMTLRYRDSQGARRMFRFIMKRLEADRAREAGIYEHVVPVAAPSFAPELLGVHSFDGEIRLCIEAVRRTRAWPWAETGLSTQVMKNLAALHMSELPSELAEQHLDWDYERELRQRAVNLLGFLEQSRHPDVLPHARRNLRALRRVVEALPTILRELQQFEPFGRALIHGDVHPGNVLVRRQAAKDCPVLVDWGRVRIGSALEDVSSWLQSLAFWEPEARRRHDTLLAAYLEARGEPARISRDLRDAYWLAAACNLLAGAIEYHLGIVEADDQVPEKRRAAASKAAADCLRVIRRADICWRR